MTNVGKQKFDLLKETRIGEHIKQDGMNVVRCVNKCQRFASASEINWDDFEIGAEDLHIKDEI